MQVYHLQYPIQERRKLANKKVAIQDNTAVAFLVMMSSSSMMEGYTPDYDATIVRRILEEGGIIVGKTTYEGLCLSGGSFLTKYGPVTNPYNEDYPAGDSSSDSGVVVALGEADMAIGVYGLLVFLLLLLYDNIEHRIIRTLEKFILCGFNSFMEEDPII